MQYELTSDQPAIFRTEVWIILSAAGERVFIQALGEPGFLNAKDPVETEFAKIFQIGRQKLKH